MSGKVIKLQPKPFHPAVRKVSKQKQKTKRNPPKVTKIKY